jgi:hypothetical protein
MRRAITEWGLVLTIVLGVALALVWVDSISICTLREPLSLAPELFLRVENGRLCLHSDLGDDWKPTLFGMQRTARSWVRGYWNWFAPGVEYHNRLFANGRTIWSLELSLVIPAAFLLIVMAILWRVRRGSKHADSRAGVSENSGRNWCQFIFRRKMN